MAIELLDDVVEDIANQFGVYGSHDERCGSLGNPICRQCWASQTTMRIRQAISVENRLRESEGKQ